MPKSANLTTGTPLGIPLSVEYNSTLPGFASWCTSGQGFSSCSDASPRAICTATASTLGRYSLESLALCAALRPSQPPHSITTCLSIHADSVPCSAHSVTSSGALSLLRGCTNTSDSSDRFGKSPNTRRK